MSSRSEHARVMDDAPHIPARLHTGDGTKLVMVRGPSSPPPPAFTVPEGYGLRMWTDGDQSRWVELMVASGEFSANEAEHLTPEDLAADRFQREFQGKEELLSKRCFVLEENATRAVAGMAMAWMLSADHAHAPPLISAAMRLHGGQPCGRVHWVAVHPSYQGRGLAKVLVARVIEYLEVEQVAPGSEESCIPCGTNNFMYLTTQPDSARAIRMYFKHFDFKPAQMDIEGQDGSNAWELVARILECTQLLDGLTLQLPNGELDLSELYE